MNSYSVVIATYERPSELEETLGDLVKQTFLPEKVVVVDSSKDPATREVADRWGTRLPLVYERAVEASAAKQRNQGAEQVTSPLIAFFDDDIRFDADMCAKICAVFDADTREETGGIAARIENMHRPVPRGFLKKYYALQAGYSHSSYGGKVFGPGINALPSYTDDDPELVPGEWLNSTCVFYRTPLFRREKFPAFPGYSFMEDVHLSFRIGRTHKLFFHKNARIHHHDAPSTFKKNLKELARMRIHHQRRVSRELLGEKGLAFELKFLLHRIFVTVSILRQRPPGWWDELIGTWS